MKKNYNALVSLLILVAISSFGKLYAHTYYIDSKQGNDDRSGTSQKQAWKTLDKVNAHTFTAGDRIVFKRGSKWQGQLVPKSSGTKENPIVFGSLR